MIQIDIENDIANDITTAEYIICKLIDTDISFHRDYEPQDINQIVSPLITYKYSENKQPGKYTTLSNQQRAINVNITFYIYIVINEAANNVNLAQYISTILSQTLTNLNFVIESYQTVTDTKLGSNMPSMTITIQTNKIYT